MNEDKPGAIATPGYRGDGVEVGQDSGIRLLPHRPSWTPVQDSYLVPGADGNTLPARAATGCRYFLLVLAAVIEALHQLSTRIVKHHASVASRGHDMRLSPS